MRVELTARLKADPARSPTRPPLSLSEARATPCRASGDMSAGVEALIEDPRRESGRVLARASPDLEALSWPSPPKAVASELPRRGNADRRVVAWRGRAA